MPYYYPIGGGPGSKGPDRFRDRCGSEEIDPWRSEGPPSMRSGCVFMLTPSPNVPKAAWMRFSKSTHGISNRPGEGLKFAVLLGVFSHPLLGLSHATSNCGLAGAAGCSWLHDAGNSSTPTATGPAKFSIFMPASLSSGPK